MSSREAPPSTQPPVDSSDWDAELGVQLHELEIAGGETSDPALGPLYASIQKECQRRDRTVAGYLQSRSTAARRLICVAAFAVIAFAMWKTVPMVDEPARTTQWAVTLAAYGVLLVLSLAFITRPVHLPSIAPWISNSVIGLSVGATLIAALWPGTDAHAATQVMDTHVGVMAAGCMGMGLLFGVPVYAFLRLFDRGNNFGSLMAAAAAGLAGNLLLNMHCPVDSASHMLLGHASVVVLFVAGLGLVHRWIPSK